MFSYFRKQTRLGICSSISFVRPVMDAAEIRHIRIAGMLQNTARGSGSAPASTIYYDRRNFVGCRQVVAYLVVGNVRGPRDMTGCVFPGRPNINEVDSTARSF